MRRNNGYPFPRLLFLLMIALIVANLATWVERFECTIVTMDGTSTYTISSTGQQQQQQYPMERFNDHNLTLSHVVMPLHVSQLDKLRSNLKTWETYPPCSNTSASETHTDLPAVLLGS